jgi:hypothetical protein
VDALGAVELPNGEFLLVFNTLGVYVDAQGRKSRDREIMYPAMPTDVSVCDAKLLVSRLTFLVLRKGIHILGISTKIIMQISYFSKEHHIYLHYSQHLNMGT